MLPINTQTVLVAGMSDLRRWIHGYNSDFLDIVLDSSIMGVNGSTQYNIWSHR